MAEYIEREKLLELLENRKIQYPMEAWQKCGFEGGWHDAVDQIEDDIKSVPAADAVPVVHAHWKGFVRPAFHGFDDLGSPIYHDVAVWHCSICDRKTVIKENYCPNCGAKMDGEDGEQNAKA